MKLRGIVLSVVLARAASASPLDGEALRQAVMSLPDTTLTEDRADQIVAATVKAAGKLDPTLLLAQQFIESRFDPSTTSRLIGGTRRTGPWASTDAPRGWAGNLYCGMAQTQATTWSRCLALRDPQVAAAAQAEELRAWLAMAHGDVKRALGGYGCGMAGLDNGCRGYAARVLGLAQRIRRVAERRVRS